jgi:uncharacterized protein (DUF58 family)
LLTRNFVKVNIEFDECVLSKGDTCQMTIHIHNKSLFPTTPLEIEILNGEGVKCRERQVIASLLPFDKQSVCVTFEAKICGLSTVGIKKVKATDYLGLLAFPIRKVNYQEFGRKIAVIPNIADVSLRDDKILKVMQASMHAEDGDDTVEVSSNTFGGFPGCDNREYVPGDPLKRINWKQSAKRGKLLVRLDDVLASKSVNVVLDSTFLRDRVPIEKMAKTTEYGELPLEDIPAKIAEDAVETALGIARALVFSSYSVHYFVAENKKFEQYDLEENRKQYEMNQRQRTLENRIRKTKRKVMNLKTMVDNEKDPDRKAEFEAEYQRKAAVLQRQNAAYNQFCDDTGLKKRHERIQIAKWDRSQAAQARAAAKREMNKE